MSWFTTEVPTRFIQLAKTFYAELEKFFASEEKTIAKPASTAQIKKDIVSFKQGDKKWGATKLGFSKTDSIHGFGCAMTSLTMAATYLGSPTKYWTPKLKPTQLTPLMANNIMKKANVFTANTYMLYLVGGAKSLGMKGVDSGVGKRLAASARSKIDECFSKGGLVLAHVDYKKSWKGDHWILLTQRTSGGTYRGIDPAYGKTLTLYTTPSESNGMSPHVLLYGRGDSFGAKTPAKIKSYKVVRYVALYRA